MKEQDIDYKELWKKERKWAETWFSRLNNAYDMWQIYIDRVKELEDEVCELQNKLSQYQSKTVAQKPNFDGLGHTLSVGLMSIQSRVIYAGEVISLQKMTLDEAGLQKKKGKK